MKNKLLILLLIVTLRPSLLFAVINTASVTEEAYRDCINFYGVPTGHPKLAEIKKTCIEVTKTMEEWKALKGALCVGTPHDVKCKEFQNK